MKGQPKVRHGMSAGGGFSPGFRALIGMAPGRYVPREPQPIPKDTSTDPPRARRVQLTREQELELSRLLVWRQ